MNDITITSSEDISTEPTPLTGTPAVAARLTHLSTTPINGYVAADITLTREGKGDTLTFDLFAARRGNGTLYRDGEEVGALAFDESDGLYGVVYTQMAKKPTGVIHYELFHSAADAMAHAALEWIA